MIDDCLKIIMITNSLTNNQIITYNHDNDCTDVFVIDVVATLFPETRLEEGLWATIESITYSPSSQQSVLMHILLYFHFLFYSISHILFFKTFIYILYFVSPSDEISIYSGILSRLIVFINVKYLQIVYFFNSAITFAY